MQHVMKRTLLASATALGLLGLSLPALAQTLTIGTRAGPESVDPHYTASGTHAEALKHVFDTLVWSGDKLQIEPRLAESWKPLNDTTWEFKLRKGVKFHDGSDFTAEDVKFSIERIPIVSGPNPTMIYVRRVKETKIVDPHTIHIVTDGPSPTLPNDFIRLFIVSSKAAAGLTKDNANEAFTRARRRSAPGLTSTSPGPQKTPSSSSVSMPTGATSSPGSGSSGRRFRTTRGAWRSCAPARWT
jgi:peptide/nickel transport system substrate-binding protein